MSADILKSITAPVKISEASTDLIKAVQRELVRLGYPLAIDGIPGNKTIAAFHQFKSDNFLGDLDTLGATTAAKLMGVKPRLLISEERAENFFGRQLALQEIADLNNCCYRFNITTTKRLQHWMSQVAHESCNLKYCLELASGRAYEGRKDLGNTQPGWGVKFRGTGWIQVTGFYWHSEFSKFIGDPKVIEIGCTYTAKNYPASISGFWWMRNSMNNLIDNGATVEEITRRINGGLTGIADRKRYYAIACKVIQ